MQIEVWLPLAVCVAVGVAWYHALRLRERATRHAARLCERHGLQLLDQSVALHRLFLHRRHGALRVFREYRFDTSLGGQDRQSASMTLLGDRVVRVSLPSRENLAEAAPPGAGRIVPRPPPRGGGTDNVIPIGRAKRTLH